MGAASEAAELGTTLSAGVVVVVVVVVVVAVAVAVVAGVVEARARIFASDDVVACEGVVGVC